MVMVGHGDGGVVVEGETTGGDGRVSDDGE